MSKNKFEHSIVVLEDFSSIKTAILDSLKVNSNLFEIKKSDSYFIFIESVQNHNFNFCITEMSINAYRQPCYNINSTPSDKYKVEKRFQNKITRLQVLELFKSWKKAVEGYALINPFDEEDPILKQYEDEIYEGLQILDIDAEITPFDVERQVRILNFLNNTKYLLQQYSGEDVDLIVEEIESLTSQVSSLSKNKVMRRISSILAKGKKHGLKLFKEMCEETVKEFFKNKIKEIPQYLNDVLILLDGINI